MESLSARVYLLAPSGHRRGPLPWRALNAGQIVPGAARDYARRYLMLDVIYILIGAAFLGVCVLYALACDHM